ncbi:MAG: 1,4-alpha-glucan branching enzyme, partial [Eubacterium sp.]|nr:1,4-alpha-glucan branching enzyme [Eubacterium sp.]
MDIHDFYIGQAFDAYDYFGVHPADEGFVFRLYAPRAEKVELIGDFNNWEGSGHEMVQDGLSGIWSVTVKESSVGQLYKYRIYQEDGVVRDRFDPYGNGSEVRPKTAARIVDMKAYTFTDREWMEKRTKNYDSPVNIYEVHPGSWKHNPEGVNGWYRYDEFAEEIIPYLKEMGYTHVELLPIAEHPSDESWGYQVSGFFCPTSRYGEARDLMRMVDLFHRAGIGVIVDFVPVHFVTNDYSLVRFDGTALYEYPEPEIGYSEWGTCNFNYYRGEVCSFLQSAADFWLTRFHFDGIRMDAISNVIYWQGNSAKGVNQGALNFVKNMNKGLQERHPSVMLIAEDSTNYPKVTAPVEYDGLGF